MLPQQDLVQNQNSTNDFLNVQGNWNEIAHFVGFEILLWYCSNNLPYELLEIFNKPETKKNILIYYQMLQSYKRNMFTHSFKSFDHRNTHH